MAVGVTALVLFAVGAYKARTMVGHPAKSGLEMAVIGTLLFNVMHYALRPWPWVLTALASTIIYPELGDIAKTFPYVDPALIGHDMAYPAMMRFLPAGFLGLVVAGTLAAYRSASSQIAGSGASVPSIEKTPSVTISRKRWARACSSPSRSSNARRV